MFPAEAPNAAYGGLDPEDVELSPAATTVAFRSLLPPLRVPVAAGPADSPERGAFLLAFPGEASWREAWAACERTNARQCEAGARMGCSTGAAKACRPPWWAPLTALSDTARESLAERRRACEDAHMASCQLAASDYCSLDARERCRTVYEDVSVAAAPLYVHPRFHSKGSLRLLLQKHQHQQQQQQQQQQTPAPPVELLLEQRWSPEGTAAVAALRQGDAAPRPELDGGVQEKGARGECRDGGGRSHVVSSLQFQRRSPDAAFPSARAPERSAEAERGLRGAEFGWEGGLIKPRLPRHRAGGPRAAKWTAGVAGVSQGGANPQAE